MSAPFNILAAKHLPIGEAQLVEWRWPSPIDMTVCEDRHMIEMSLPPLAADGMASFPDLSPGRFSFIGNLFLRPAGIAIRARSTGGHIQVVRVAVQPASYAAIAGTEPDYGEALLRAGLDLRDDTPRMLLHRLREELTAPGFASTTLVEAYAVALVVETARSVSERAERRADTGRLAGWQYRRVCERIESDPTPPTLSELARLCGVSPRHFARLFRALTGESVTAHVARVQIARAATLLEKDNLPLKEISARLGFTNPGSFSTAFRRATGVTPSRYRRERAGP